MGILLQDKKFDKDQEVSYQNKTFYVQYEAESYVLLRPFKDDVKGVFKANKSEIKKIK